MLPGGQVRRQALQGLRNEVLRERQAERRRVEDVGVPQVGERHGAAMRHGHGASDTHAMIHMLSSESPRSAGTSRATPRAIGHVITTVSAA